MAQARPQRVVPLEPRPLTRPTRPHSADGGASWTDDTTLLAGAASTGGVASIVDRCDGALSPALRDACRSGPSSLFFVGRNTSFLWGSTSRGVSYSPPCALSPSAAGCTSAPAGAGAASQALLKLQYHPQVATVALAMTQAAVCTASSPGCAPPLPPLLPLLSPLIHSLTRLLL